jgi:capsular exopolysaccharide synthesis family protein
MSAKPLNDAARRDAGMHVRTTPQLLSWGQTIVHVDMTLALLLRMIKRRKWLLIFTMAVVPLLALVATMHMTPRYTASTDVLVEPQRLVIADIESVLTQTTPSGEVIASQIEILSSRALGAQVIERLQLYTLPEFNPALRPPSPTDRAIGFVSGLVQRGVGTLLGEDTAETAEAGAGDTSGEPELEVDQAAVLGAYLSALNVEVRNNSRVLEVAFTSQDPELAARVVNTLVDVYLVSQLEAKFDALKRASSWLNERLSSLRDQAIQSEEAVENYRAAAGLTQGVQASIVAEQISKLNAELGEARFALSAAQARLDQVRAVVNSPEQLASLPEVLNFPLIQRLVQEQVLLRQRVVELSARVGDRHPDLVNARAQVVSLGQQLALEVQRVSRGIEPEVATARGRVKALEDQLAELRENSVVYNAAEAKLRSLQREADTNQGLLQTFLERAKETTDRFELESADARLLANAIVPTWPSHPKTKIIVAVAVAFGIMLGLLLVYLAEQLDQTFRSGDDIESVLGLPCLSIVPKLSLLGSLVNPYDYVLHKPMSAFAEAFRSLRATLWLGGQDDGRGACKSVAIMSSRPGEGKTAAAISLARVAAAAGERVILVDCDVRQPSVGKALKAAPDVGLVDILTGKTTREQAVRRDAGSGMDYIVIGTNTPNSAQLLMSDAMASLAQSLRADYDLVILDAPPILALSDARILATVVDAVVYCVLWRETSRSAVTSGVRILHGIGARVVGAVLTQVNLSTHARAGFTDSEFYSRKYSGYYHN